MKLRYEKVWKVFILLNPTDGENSAKVILDDANVFPA